MPDNDTILYCEALQEIDASDVELADGFEMDFLTSNLARAEQYGDRTWFSDKQKRIIRRMYEKCYGEHAALERFHGQQRLV